MEDTTITNIQMKVPRFTDVNGPGQGVPVNTESAQNLDLYFLSLAF